MTQHNMPRCAFTLKELVISMSVGSLLMVSAIGVMTQSFRSVKNARHRMDDDRTFFQLSRDWRGDAHLATSVSHDGESINFMMDNERIVRFEVDPDSISRTILQSGTPVARQTFRWKLQKTCHIETDPSAATARLLVRRSIPEAPDLSAPIWRTCNSVIGLRIRHQSADLDRETDANRVTEFVSEAVSP